ncbi:uncharacterized protein [Watersipora subatra]|uniref:uncharacterized protein n=1 Tax=Watersipora subatra TaxID=2589382 RepID=UPI00355C1C06
MELTVDAGPQTNFRIRTASVSLKVDIHPPCGLNINHVDGESSHSRCIEQGKEILHYVVFKELKREGLEIPEQCVIFKSLLCTSGGFLLLRWESLCKVIHSFMMHSPLPSALPEYINSKCHCARRLRPQGCSGYLCLILAHARDHAAFHRRVAVLLYHTVCASRWALQQQQPLLLDRILVDAVLALDTISSEHSANCQGGWGCIQSLRQPRFSTNYLLYRCRLNHPVPLIVAFGAGVITTLVLYKLIAGSSK